MSIVSKIYRMASFSCLTDVLTNIISQSPDRSESRRSLFPLTLDSKSNLWNWARSGESTRGRSPKMFWWFQSQWGYYSSLTMMPPTFNPSLLLACGVHQGCSPSIQYSLVARYHRNKKRWLCIEHAGLRPRLVALDMAEKYTQHKKAPVVVKP
jgi:hypothetical protein